MSENTLSIIIPVYNEAGTLAELLKQVCEFDFGETKTQILIVDDGSSDNSVAILKNLQANYNYTLLTHPKNLGKGAAIRTALARATSAYTIIQDADLEYNVSDIAKLLQYVKTHNSPVVFGSRELTPHLHSSRLFLWGGKLVTWVTNVLYGTHITDEPTCYKLIRTDVLRSLRLQCNRFEFCPEVTAKLARAGYSIPEVPISYRARKPEMGKKIRYYDGLHALVTLVRYLTWKP